MTRFRSKNVQLISGATAILEVEKPMTLRQLYYRCVSAGLLENCQKEYKRLGTAMTRLRESGAVPRTWIVDHVRATLKPSSWSGLADFGDTVREAYRRDFWASLPDHVEVFVEKDAVAGTIQPVTKEYDVALRVCRGYSSVSFAGEIGDEWAQIEKPIFAYYLGDHDPSGIDLERDLREKLERYSGVDFYWRRLGILDADFSDFELIELPAKRTDNRWASFVASHGERCAELDALPPTEIRARVENAITSHIEPEEWDRLQKIERIEREAVQGAIGNFAKEKLNLDSVS